MALMLQAMTKVLLDMPVAPLAQAAAEMVGEDTRHRSDLTLRRMVPRADRAGKRLPATFRAPCKPRAAWRRASPQ